MTMEQRTLVDAALKRPKMRDRALAVTCPTCAAPPAQSCGLDAAGKPDVHPMRISLADRTVFSR